MTGIPRGGDPVELGLFELEGQVTNLDRNMGYPDPCKYCGFAWSVHRGSDGLCPATRDGKLWRGAWEKDGAKGTRYRPKK